MAKRAFQYAQATMGWLLLFVVVGGAVGVGIQFRQLDGALGCVDTKQAFGIFELDCRNKIFEEFLLFAISIPRLILIFPVAFLALIKVAVINYALRTAMNGLPFFVISFPFVALSWLGIQYWWKKQRLVGVTVLVTLLAVVIFLAAKA